MDIIEAFQRLSLALAIGVLVGIERGWQEREEAAGKRTAGIRTFGLTGFLGGLAGFLQPFVGPMLPAALLVVFGIAFVVFKRFEAEQSQDYSVTSVVAALVVFALGTVAVVSNMSVAAAGGVAATALLAARHSLHGFLRNLTWLELRAALVLLAMTLVALPLLPDRTVDPWNSINPFQLWLLTIMIAAISYAGYLAIRIVGPKYGILFSGAAGGFISSTAVTLSFARMSAASAQAATNLAAGASIAGALSIGRVLVISGIMAPVLVPLLAVALAPVILVLLVASFWLARRSASEKGAADVHLDNPFELMTVLRFGAFLGIIMCLSRVMIERVGTSTIYGVALLSGVADVDAITLSTAQMVGSVLTKEIAATAILLAAAVNLIVKMVLAIVFGDRGYSIPFSIATIIGIVAGAAGYAGATMIS
ncbi:DUF4010 domain-containing protein [Neorhizobium sp. P12A]|jgi:uncharacterized membrane protein (DUF4010 family)|uniref:MgtC/SapB family protein n=1 Tax=Rhizobium/Agrobacterium group TaxID=227290 RepID=UPI00104DAC35|nr:MULTISPECIES: DUF4010 domain-containing protein [Rhizobium/Agrobacterium group]KAA0699905.1 DUF4010 domain-containing protein [Neorhizobium sp. P12A]